MRTAALDGAHVEMFRGIRNPVAVKVGPGMTADWLKGLIRTLNPDNEPGRLVLIHRMGAKAIADKLPPLIQAARSTGTPLLWICDPMHGNTEKTASVVLPTSSRNSSRRSIFTRATAHAWVACIWS